MSQPLDLDYLEMTARDFLGEEERQLHPNVFQQDVWKIQLGLIVELRAARKVVATGEQLHEAVVEELADLRAAHEKLRDAVVDALSVLGAYQGPPVFSDVQEKLRVALEEKP